MALDLAGWSDLTDWSVGVDTLTTDYNQDPILDSAPETMTDYPRSDGVTFGDLLKTVSAGADTLTNTFTKLYSLQSNVENAKFGRVVQEQTLALKKSQALGDLAVKKAQVDAAVAIETARARRVVGDEVARVSSSERASTIGKNYMPLLLLGGIALTAYYLLKK